MSLRPGNIGLVVAIGLMIVGFAIVGTNPSDTEMRLICLPALVVGIAVTLTLVGREDRGDGRRSSR
jgi:hypothetical protein